MSPHDIKVLFHHHHIRDVWPLGDTRAYRGSLEWLFHNGLTDRSDAMALTTARGDALVAMLCATPLPVQAFINPQTCTVVAGDAIPTPPQDREAGK